MQKLYSPATIQRIKREYNFRFSKSLGQNFLIDSNIINRIVSESLICNSDLVIEIGPGIGTLTAAIAKEAGNVVAIEIDKNLIPILKETLKDYENVEIINQDFLKTDLIGLIDKIKGQTSKSFDSIKIVGNLPYYITTPIIMKILESDARHMIESAIFMLQKEVADRIVSNAGSKDYGRISVIVQYYCEVERIASVSKEVFYPRPKVDSSVLRFTMREESAVKLISEPVFFTIVKAGFGQRRKTLLNTLNGVYGCNKEEVRRILEDANINPTRRAETLDIKEFATLSNIFSQKA